MTIAIRQAQSRLLHAALLMGVVQLQVYLLLDEFIMGGELQETSKKVYSSASGLTCSLYRTCNLMVCSWPSSVKYTTGQTQAWITGVQVVLERLAELDKIET